MDNVISRLSALMQTNTATTLENYDYLGLNTIVRVGHPQSGVDLTYEKQTGDTLAVNDGGDIYVGLDRFGRTADQNYVITGVPTTSTDRFQYGFDANGNAMYRKNTVNTAFSELYHTNGTTAGYDNLNRLTNFSRGTLNSGNNTISSPTATRGWSLDAQGNWAGNAAGQTYTINNQNQITLASGSPSATFGYDNDGNLTSRPAPAGSNTSANDAFAYDAWDREAQFTRTFISSGGSEIEVAANIDALGRRTQVVTTGTGGLGGVPLPTDDLYYSTSWQVLEDDNSKTTNGGSSSGFNQMQFVWSPTYVNDLVLRDRSTAGNGSFNETLYVQHDANHDVTAITNSSGVVQERFIYDSYGVATVRNPSTWASMTDTLNWQYMFQGGRFDSNSGLYTYQRREYDPALGRWMQQDPAGYVDGMNLGQFVQSNPQDKVDPSGKSGTWEWGGWVDYTGIGTIVHGGYDLIYGLPRDGAEYVAVGGVKLYYGAKGAGNALNTARSCAAQSSKAQQQQYNNAVQDFQKSYEDFGEGVVAVASTIPGTVITGPIIYPGGEALGHAIEKHGSQATEFLLNRLKNARNLTHAGQWLENEAAAKWLQEVSKSLCPGVHKVPLPNTVKGRILSKATGAWQDATHATIVKLANGTLKTAFPDVP